MSGMSSSRENNASSYMENPPVVSHIMQQNESKHLQTRPIITISSSDPSGEVENEQGTHINSTNGMPTVTYFLGNLKGEASSHAHTMTVDNHNTVSAAFLFDNVNSSQMGGRASNTSHIHGFAVNDNDESMSSAALLSDFNGPLVEHNFINMGSNAAAGVQLNNQFDTAPNTSQAYSHKVHDVVANQCSTFQRPQIINNCISSGNSAAGVRLNSQQGAGIASGIRALSQGGGPTGTSLVHCAPNNHNVISSLIRYSNSKSLQMNSWPINVEGNMAAGFRVNSQGGAARMQQTHSFTANSTNDMSSANLLSNLQASGVNRSSMTTEGNVAVGVGANNQNKAVVASNLRSSSLSLDETLRPQNERNLISAESDKPELFQSQYHKRSIENINTMIRGDQTGVAPCTEQIDNFLNLGFGGNSAACFPSHVFGGGVTYNNGWPVVSQSYNFHMPQPDGNFLSLGGNVGDQLLSNNSSQTVGDTNDGANPDQYGISQSTPATVQYLPVPSGRILGTGSNRNVGSANMYPNSGVQRPLGVAPIPFNSIPDGLLANEQARLLRVAPAASNLMGIQNGSFPNHLEQAYTYGMRSIPGNPHMVSPHSNSVQRTFAPDNSGKRGASEGGLSAQSAKVLRSPSTRVGRTARLAGHTVAAQTPVPMAGHNEAAQTPIPMAGHMVASQRPIPLAGHTGAVLPPLPLAGLSGAAQTYRAFTQPVQESPPKSSYSTGENCQLCKRDLRYAPTGPFTQPPVPPAVVVLPCGHFFHDECLERITPAEQSKNPPCIPCAIGAS